MTRVQLTKAKPKNNLERSINFEYYAPQAKNVFVAGDFNRWDTTKCRLNRSADGWWRTQLQLKAGRYEYRYLVDGDWENDQRPVECVPNAFGAWNCVVEVK